MATNSVGNLILMTSSAKEIHCSLHLFQQEFIQVKYNKITY